jgi:hypothetical protein
MPERSGKRRDLNELAKAITDEAANETDAEPEVKDSRDPVAVELGRRGGLKGGKARAKKLSARRRSEIARKAATTRWAGRKSSE